MALFKAVQGPSSRIDLQSTPFHEGWIYLTTDDGKLYVDVVRNSTQERICLNEEPTISPDEISITLPASGWVNNEITVSVTGMTATTKGYIGMSESITSAQYAAVSDAKLVATAHGNGTVTFTAFGTAPTVDIPVTIILF